jgi:hypothetical protein
MSVDKSVIPKRWAPNTPPTAVADRYDHALRYARHRHLPPDAARPQPTATWPPENITLLAHYRDWLASSGTSVHTTNHLYIPMAGHVLGLNRKPHPQLDLKIDLDRALVYIKAKRLSASWTMMCRNALEKFRRFMRQQRGQPDGPARPPSHAPARYRIGLPNWLVEQLENYQRLRQRNWRPARLSEQIRRFWGSHTRLWRWLFAHYALTTLAGIKRQYLLDYIDHCQAAGYAPGSINHDLNCFRASLLYLQDQDYPVPPVLLRLPTLKPPDSLPRFLTDEQVSRLRDDFEQRVAHATSPGKLRDALLDRAAFYLFWQGGVCVT